MPRLLEVPAMNSIRSTESPTTQPSPVDDVSRTKSILVAEDDDEMRNLLVQALNDEGYLARGCRDGIELINQFDDYVAHRVPLPFALIISDIRMPWLTGLDVLQEFRKYVGFPRMILITAFGDSDTHQRARELGAAALLDKPFAVSQLIQLVEQVLHTPIPSPAHPPRKTDTASGGGMEHEG
jgi:DNA-binding NtrC family response regulator